MIHVRWALVEGIRSGRFHPSLFLLRWDSFMNTFYYFPPFNSEDENDWSCASTLPCAFMICRGTPISLCFCDVILHPCFNWHVLSKLTCLRITCMCFVVFDSPLAYLDPISCNMTYMFVQLFKDALNEYAYAAELAGMKWELTNTKYGMIVSTLVTRNALGWCWWLSVKTQNFSPPHPFHLLSPFVDISIVMYIF